MDFDTNNHSVFILHYRLIMCVKYRNKVINDNVSNRLREIIVEGNVLVTELLSYKHGRCDG